MHRVTTIENPGSNGTPMPERESRNIQPQKRGDWLTHRDIVIGESERYSHSLYRLSVRYGQSPSFIAQTTVAARDLLHSHNVSITLQELLMEMAYVYPACLDDGKCCYHKILNLYVGMRCRGLSRKDARHRLMEQLLVHSKK